MSIRTAFLWVALGIGTSVMPAFGSASASMEVGVAPPPPRNEVVPEARAGYIWVAGYWGWSGTEHVWVNGQYVPERLHHHWVTARWEQRGKKWFFEDGRWDSDEDHNE